MTTNPPTEGDSPTGSNTITLHILCPSIPAPGRFTLHDQPLSETIAQIKARITESLASRPGPAQQRLIYRGKPLADDRATLASVLGPIDVSEKYFRVSLRDLGLIVSDYRDPRVQFTWSCLLPQLRHPLLRLLHQLGRRGSANLPHPPV